MTSTSGTPNEGEDRRQNISRRNLLGALGAVGAVFGSGCGAGGRREAQSERPTKLADTTDRTFSRIERDRTYDLSYRWSGFERRWSLDVSVAKERYAAAVRANRSLARSFREAKTSPIAHRVARGLSREIDRTGIDTVYDRLSVAVEFVRSFRYVRDEAGTGEKEYPKYVPETLVENSGDCEDYATLLAGILSSATFGLDPVLLIVPGHAGVGLDPNRFETETPPVTPVGEREYVFVDATNRVPIGEVPELYESEPVIAVYADGWRLYDPPTLLEQVKETVVEDRIIDPSIYL